MSRLLVIFIALLLTGCYYSQEEYDQAIEDAYYEGYDDGYSAGYIDSDVLNGDYDWDSDSEDDIYDSGYYDGYSYAFSQFEAIFEEIFYEAEGYAREKTGWSVYEAWNNILMYWDDPSSLSKSDYEDSVETLVYFSEYLDEYDFDPYKYK